MILSDGNYFDEMTIEAGSEGHHEIHVGTAKPGNAVMLSIKEVGIEGQRVIAVLSPDEARRLQYMLLSAVNTALQDHGGAQ